MQAMEISRSGLDVEWQRLQVIAQNLANVNTSRTANGSPYYPVRLLSGPKGSFASLMSSSAPMAGVQVLGIERTNDVVRQVYDPSHPHADANGFVTYPAIDHAGEMTLMIKASRAYEANVTAMNLARDMYTRALELGRQS